MLNLNTPIKLPVKTFWYFVTKYMIGIVFISFVFSILSREIYFLPTFILITIILGIPLILRKYIYYVFINFTIENNKITINSGMINKKSDSIAFDKVQTIKNIRGPIAQIFGLSKIEIWTSSPSQIIIKNQKTENYPDGVLFLKIEDAEWLKKFVLDRH